MHAAHCKRDIAQGNMQYINCKNVRASLKALAEVPQWYKNGGFLLIPRGRKGRIFLAMRNEITIAMCYNLT